MVRENLIIENATVVMPDRILEGGSIKIEEGRISEIREGFFKSGKRRIDAKGFLLLPGFVDIHSDAIEKEIEPRPNVFFPMDIAIVELDRRLASCGVTTVFHSISFAEGEIGLRSNEVAYKITEEINKIRKELRIKTRVHCRFEITNQEAITFIERLLREEKINLLSFMDHTPGQGQFRDIISYKNYFGKVYRKTEKELEEILKKKFSLQKTSRDGIFYLATLCSKLNVPMASHDDDSPEKIDFMKKLNVKISEFPVNKETAEAAKAEGISVCVGAPNALRGGSQVKNLSARQAIAEGIADVVCSDYSPQTLLHSLFKLYELKVKPLWELVNMYTLYPALATGISDRVGSIEEGKEADLILINQRVNPKRVIKTFVSGIEVFSTI